MANAIVSTRADLIDLWNKTYDYWVWTNAKTYVVIEYPLMSEYDRFIRSIPGSDFPWTTALSFARAVLQQDGWTVLKIFGSALREDWEHYQKWKSSFGDDDLWMAFRWLHSAYRIRQADGNCIAFVWDAT